MKIMLIVGARPNFMKVASIISAVKTLNQSAYMPVDYILIHTGQHYDEQMSDAFFRDLDLPLPDVNLEVGSVSHACQTAEVMKRFEPVLLKECPDAVVVVGDVNSTLACSLVASKITYPPFRKTSGYSRPLVAHVEAGLRSFDRSMPEEINRIVTDAVSDLLFITEKSAEENLLREGVSKDKIYFVGNTMADTLLKQRRKAMESEILLDLGLKKGKTVRGYSLLTLHRPSNVDNKDAFQEILEAMSYIAKDVPIVFPVHPRTRQRIKEFGFEKYFDLTAQNIELAAQDYRIRCIEPLGYLDCLCLMSNARLVLTDSGGIQEETTLLGTPCVTLRQNTERPVTITEGTNVLAGGRKEEIIYHAHSQLRRSEASVISRKPDLWDGRAGERIINVITDHVMKIDAEQEFVH